MHVWSSSNQKGGVGKTTSVVTLGGLAAQSGERVLMVDLDPHGSLTAYFGHDPESLEQSAYDLFREGAPRRERVERLLLATAVPGLSLLPASTALATLDRQLGRREGMGLVIARALAAVEESFDVAIIDCPPMLGVLMVNALAACQHLIIPVQTEFLAIKGLERMRHTLGMIEKARGISVPYTIVPTMFDRRTRASVDSLRTLRTQFSDRIWRSAIPVDTRFREASRRGLPLSHIDPAARGVQAYRMLLDDLLALGGVARSRKEAS